MNNKHLLAVAKRLYVFCYLNREQQADPTKLKSQIYAEFKKIFVNIAETTVPDYLFGNGEQQVPLQRLFGQLLDKLSIHTITDLYHVVYPIFNTKLSKFHILDLDLEDESAESTTGCFSCCRTSKHTTDESSAPLLFNKDNSKKDMAFILNYSTTRLLHQLVTDCCERLGKDLSTPQSPSVSAGLFAEDSASMPLLQNSPEKGETSSSDKATGNGHANGHNNGYQPLGDEPEASRCCIIL